jgi:hypothetical protein
MRIVDLVAIVICIIVAITALIFTYEYVFVAHAYTTSTTSTTTSTSSTSTSSTTSTSTTTTIPYVSVAEVINGSYPSVGGVATLFDPSGDKIHLNGTLAWEGENKSNGWYSVTSNKNVIGSSKGGYNDSLNFTNNPNFVALTGLSCQVDQYAFYTAENYSCYPSKLGTIWSTDLIFSGRNYSFTGTLEYVRNGGHMFWLLNISDVGTAKT